MKSGPRLLPAALAGLALACATTETPDQAAPPGPVPARFQPAVSYSAERGGTVLLVIERGETVLESAGPGRDPRAPQPLHGASDAFWGVLGVAAAEDGLLELDEPVSATLPEFAGRRGRGEITLRQLLDFTSGLESGYGRAVGSDEVFRLEMVAPPGERFQYGPSHLRVFVTVLGRKLAAAGQNPDPLQYLEERILEPIDAELAGWSRDQSGYADPGDGASMDAQGWARFGALLLHRGRVQEREVVSTGAMEQVFRGSEPNPTFGLGVWLNTNTRRLIGERWGGRAPAPAFYADGLSDLVVATGAGNQRLYVIPSLETVIVRFGVADHAFRDAELLSLLVTALRDSA